MSGRSHGQPLNAGGNLSVPVVRQRGGEWDADFWLIELTWTTRYACTWGEHEMRVQPLDSVRISLIPAYGWGTE